MRITTCSYPHIHNHTYSLNLINSTVLLHIVPIISTGPDFRNNSTSVTQVLSSTPDIIYLQQMAQVYYHNGLAPSTNYKSTYSAGQHRFLSFCKSAKLQPVPASESTLLLFATYLANTNISYATIKIYISATRHSHITIGMHSFFNLQLTPRLQQVLKGIQKSQSVTHPPKVCLLITIEMMESIKHLIFTNAKDLHQLNDIGSLLPGILWLLSLPYHLICSFMRHHTCALTTSQLTAGMTQKCFK